MPRILLVDDDAFSRMLVRQHLPRHYEITECADAESAMHVTRTTPHDVALLDVQMPGIDGFELCRYFKKDPLNSDMPVIVVTARSGIEDLEQGFEAGATDYIRKPFNPRELVVRVRNAVELKKRGDALRDWSERINADLALAGALQRSLLAPRSFLGEDIRVHAAYQSSIEVGGDFFDMLSLPGGRTAIYVGDVSGHGVGAAIASTLLKASLAELLREHADAGPAQVANQLHRLFLDQFRAPNMYATLLLAIREPGRSSWRCLNCGHPPAIILGADGQLLRKLESKGGNPVGFCLAGPEPYSLTDEYSLTVNGDMMLMLMTDGILEAPNTAHPEISARDMLHALIERWRHSRSGPPVEYIFNGLREAGYVLGHDDCTAMILESVPERQVVFRASGPLTLNGLTEMADDMEKALSEAGWPEASRWAAHLLLVEHGANVLTHGRPPADAQLSVQTRLLDQSIELLIRDNGQPWKYEEVRPPSEPEGLESHGRGLMIIRRSTTFIVSQRIGDENLTLFTLTRNWKMPE